MIKISAKSILLTLIIATFLSILLTLNIDIMHSQTTFSFYPNTEVPLILKDNIYYCDSNSSQPESFFENIDAYIVVTGNANVTTLEPSIKATARYKAFAHLIIQDPDLYSKSIIISGFRGLGLEALTTEDRRPLSEADTAYIVVMNILKSKANPINLYKEQSSFDTTGNAWHSLEILQKIKAQNIMIVSSPEHIQRVLICFDSISQLFYQDSRFKFKGVGASMEEIPQNFETPKDELIKIDQYLYKLEIFNTPKKFLVYFYQIHLAQRPLLYDSFSELKKHTLASNCTDYSNYDPKIQMICDFNNKILLKERSKATEEDLKNDSEFLIKNLMH